MRLMDRMFTNGKLSKQQTIFQMEEIVITEAVGKKKNNTLFHSTGENKIHKTHFSQCLKLFIQQKRSELLLCTRH